MPETSLHTLLEGAIDYAGLFPPAQLDMESAVARYAEHRAGEECWMLGRFVVPIARLEELESAARPQLAADDEAAAKGRGKKSRGKEGNPAGPWHLAALAGADVEGDATRVLQFNSRHATGRRVDVIIESVEARAATRDEIERFAKAFKDTGVQLYVELPLGGDARPLVEAACACGVRAKARAGGVTPDAFPGAADLARFVVACAEAGVPFKATAGLHHAMRGEHRLTYDDGAPRGTMFGFLNVRLAAALAREGAPAADLEPLLEERSASAIVFDGEGATWRERRITTTSLARARREGLTAIGSCSFTEPVEELKALGWL
jgi:hypothetical protein